MMAVAIAACVIVEKQRWSRMRLSPSRIAVHANEGDNRVRILSDVEVTDNAIEGSMHGVDIQGALCTVSAVALDPPLADVDRACAEGRGE